MVSGNTGFVEDSVNPFYMQEVRLVVDPAVSAAVDQQRMCPGPIASHND